MRITRGWAFWWPDISHVSLPNKLKSYSMVQLIYIRDMILMIKHMVGLDLRHQ